MPDTDMTPLFSPEQAQAIRDVLTGFGAAMAVIGAAFRDAADQLVASTPETPSVKEPDDRH